MFKRKQIHKNREQILFDKEQEKIAKVRKEFIDIRFLPLMEKITTNLAEAQFITESLKVAINQAFQNKSKEILVKDLKLKESLLKAKKQNLVQKHIQVIEVLEEQTIADAVKLCDALYEESNRVLLNSLKTKKLSDFSEKENNGGK